MPRAALKAEMPITADVFLQTDPSVFGDAWRYELVDGRPIAMAPPSEEHGYIIGRLVQIVGRELDRKNLPCKIGVGIGMKPANAPGNKIRIPDAMIACEEDGASKFVLFEIMSPSNSGSGYRIRRHDLKSVPGVREIVEIDQDGYVAHILRRHEAGWLSVDVIGADQSIILESLGIEIAMAELYTDVPPLSETKEPAS